MAMKKKQALPFQKTIRDALEAERQKATEIIRFYDGLETHIKELRKKKAEGLIETLYRCPPGSLLENIVNLFWQKTDIPLNMVYWMALTFIAGFLTQRGICVGLEDGTKEPLNFWTLILGESAAGKTFVLGKMDNILDENVCIKKPGFQSKAAVVSQLSIDVAMRKAVIEIDEFAQTIKLIHGNGGDLRLAFLQAYDGVISHTTKKEGLVEVKDIQLSIIAATVGSVFKKIVTSEDLLDGLMQRFLMIEADITERNLPNWPYSITPNDITLLKQQAQELTVIPENKTYYLSTQARDIWAKWYHIHWKPDLESHYKRYLWHCLKLSGIFHAMVHPERDEISHDSMGWAIRAIDNSLESLYGIMKGQGFDQWQRLSERVEKYWKGHPGQEVRDICMNMKLRKKELEIACKLLVDRGVMPETTWRNLFGL